jgi:hypothetical protein
LLVLTALAAAASQTPTSLHFQLAYSVATVDQELLAVAQRQTSVNRLVLL